MEEVVEKDKKTILVVDDEKSIMELLVFNLQKEGYNTLEAYDGVTAVEMAINEKPDLILLDVMIPKLDGIFTSIADFKLLIFISLSLE